MCIRDRANTRSLAVHAGLLTSDTNAIVIRTFFLSGRATQCQHSNWVLPQNQCGAVDKHIN